MLKISRSNFTRSGAFRCSSWIPNVLANKILRAQLITSVSEES